MRPFPKLSPILIPIAVIASMMWSVATWLLPLMKATGHIDWPWWVSFLPLILALVIGVAVAVWIVRDMKREEK